MKIKSARRIPPELSRCIEVDSSDRLFAAGGANGDSFVSHNSVAQRNILLGTILRPESWRFLGIDLKRVELSTYRAYSNVVLGIATELEDALTVLRFAQQTMMRRYEELEQLGLNNFLDLPQKGQALMIMVDEAGELLGASGVKALTANTYVPNLNGRRNISEIQIGDTVFDNFGKRCKVLDKYIPSQQEQFDLTIGNAFSVSSGKLSKEVIRCGSDHYWVVYAPGEKKPRVLRTRDLFSELELTKPGSYWTIERVRDGIEGEEQNLPVNPWDLGVYLSRNGNLSEDQRKLLKFDLNERSLPDLYLYSSREQRLELLSGLFSNSFEKPYLVIEDLYLVQDVQRLIASLGFEVHMKKVLGGIEISYDQHFKKSYVLESLKPVEKTFDIEDSEIIEKEAQTDEFEELYCLRVNSPESQFLCTENFIPTHNTDEGKEQDLLKGEAAMIIGSIARLGRAAGVHMVIATQRPDATLLSGEVKANLGVRINCGHTDSTASSMILGSGEGYRVKSNPRGRLYLSIDGKGDHGQGFFAGESWIDEYLASKGLNPDGSPLSKKQSRLAKLTDFDSDFGEGTDLDSKTGINNSEIIEKIRQEEEVDYSDDEDFDRKSLDPEGDTPEDWGFLDDPTEDSEDDEDDEEVEEESSETKPGNWGGLELGKGGGKSSKRPEDDWDSFMDEITADNFKED